ncbi:MAG: outer membrane lipoprotein-sorting protein [Bacillota bacterium]
MFKLYKSILFIVIFSLALVFFSTGVRAISVEEIIDRIDENEYYQQVEMEAEMIIIDGGRKMVKEMTTVARDNKALVRFNNPRDRGTKYLKKGDDLWMYFPEAEDVVKISGHMLEQGMMGSDFSYQDIMEADKLTDLYEFELTGEEKYNDRSCYLVEGVAREGKEVSYYRRKIWIDKERFIALKEELYAESDRLLKVSIVEEVDEIDGRWYPVKSVMENKLREDTRTEFEIKSIDFNPTIEEGVFSRDNLQ